MITVFLVDDHELARRGIAGLFEAEADIEIVGEAGTAAQARSRSAFCVRLVPPDKSSITVLPDWA